jgi:hypothetical protein
MTDSPAAAQVPEPVRLPAMTAEQAASWHALMDLYGRMAEHWTLVGGQMVHLHCAERAVRPERPTHDADTVVDIRADPRALDEFTGVLRDLGFGPEMSGEGLQHRWTRSREGVRAQIDVLLPDGIGARASARHGSGGAPTLSTPGGTQALQRSEPLLVSVEGRTGWVRRPNLLGALVMKAAAHTAVDAALGRHRHDFATLAGLIAARDVRDERVTAKDRQRLRAMIAVVRADDSVMLRSADVEAGLARVQRAVDLRN